MKRKHCIVPKVRKEDLKKCTACGGSGFYDNTDHYGRVPKCGSCEGSGLDDYPGDAPLPWGVD